MMVSENWSKGALLGRCWMILVWGCEEGEGEGREREGEEKKGGKK